MKNQNQVPAIFAGEAKEFSKMGVLERVRAVSQMTAVDAMFEQHRERQFNKWFSFLEKQAIRA